MGFFKDFKDDISQAVNDLMPADASKDNKKDVTQNTTNLSNSEGQISSEGLDSSVDQNSLTDHNNSDIQIDSVSTNVLDLVTAESSDVIDMYDEEDNIDKDLLNAILTMDKEELDDNRIQSVVIEDISEEKAETVAEMVADTVNEDIDNETYSLEEEKSHINLSIEPSEVSGSKSQQTKSYIEPEEVTIIAKGTTINGNIASDCSLEIMGTIKGDVTCFGKLSIIGTVIGTCMAEEVYVASNRLEGCINSEGSVKIGLGTIIIGDVAGTSAVIAGAVKGDIDVNGPVIIDSSAVIKGNIKAQTIQINHGAIIEGMCSTSYASIDIDSIFE